MRSPETTKLSKQIANLLEEEIRNGRWVDQLPGYRILCQEMGVGRKAITSALAILTRRNVIFPAEQGRQRIINRKDLTISLAQNRKHRKHLTILMGRPLHKMCLGMQQTLETVTLILFRKGWKVDFQNVYRSKHVLRKGYLEKVTNLDRSRRWLLASQPCHISSWFANNRMDAISFGGTHTSLLPRITLAVEDGIIQIIQHMFKQGRTRVVVPVIEASDATYDSFARAVEPIYRSWGVRFTPRYHLPRISCNVPHLFRQYLESCMQITPPDALILTQHPLLLTTYSFAVEQGLNVPRDIAISVAMEPPNAEWLHPQPIYFRAPVNYFTRTLVNWIENYPTDISKCSKCLKPTLVNFVDQTGDPLEL